MGIYPEDTKGPVIRDEERGLETWTEYRTWPGFVQTRELQATLWKETERTDCFCCSCGDREGSDPACRNHGWAAQRPCEAHNMPGQAWEPEPGETEGKMPESVQEVLRARGSWHTGTGTGSRGRRGRNEQ